MRHVYYTSLHEVWDFILVATGSYARDLNTQMFMLACILKRSLQLFCGEGLGKNYKVKVRRPVIAVGQE